MLFGERLLSIRKKKKVSQDELAKQIGVHAPVIGRYERNEVKPSIEVATNIANALGVSLDFLVGITDVDLDNDVLNQVMDIQKLNDDDKKQITSTINALLRDAKARKAYSK
jgi:transcriptional regulator with XRE-family HTH domain